MPEKSKQLLANENRFGNIAVAKGFITPELLVEAQNNQVIEEISYGKHRLIGKILLEYNYMTPEQIEAVLAGLIED